MQLGVGGIDLLHFSHPGILPQGQPGAVGGQQCGARGPSPSARSCLGQGQDRRASVLVACFFCCCYWVLWGEPGRTRGEHANSTQKGPGTSPDMLHDAGLEPTTFLLWGNSATHWATVTPRRLRRLAMVAMAIPDCEKCYTPARPLRSASSGRLKATPLCARSRLFSALAPRWWNDFRSGRPTHARSSAADWRSTSSN